MATFESLGLIPKLVQAVASKGYTEPTAIQAKAIPAVLEGRDVLGGSQTGTGKTAAFALPILQRLHNKRRKGTAPRALILAPTRELAAQVEASIFEYSKGLGIYSVAIFGGVKMPPQVAKLRRGVGIVVATPGRLLDHAGGGTIDLSQVEVLVLDEADRMLDMGFMPDIKRIVALLPGRRQNLMFSATYSGEIRGLAESLLNDPLSVEVARRNTAAERVNQVVHPVERTLKRELLSQLIEEGDWRQVLVFARTRHGAQRLSKQLDRNGASAVAIHGDKTQGQRTRALERFKRGEVRVLVATDVASRGLDIRALPHVVNFELPDVAEDYIHRIGRTGRAGEEGDAHSLVCHAERGKLADIEALLGKSIPRREIEGYEGEDIELGSRERRKSGSGKAKSKRGGGARTRSDRPRGQGGRRRVANPERPASEGESRPAKKKSPQHAETKEQRRKRKPKWSRAQKREARAERADGSNKRPPGRGR